MRLLEGRAALARGCAVAARGLSAPELSGLLRALEGVSAALDPAFSLALCLPVRRPPPAPAGGVSVPALLSCRLGDAALGLEQELREGGAVSSEDVVRHNAAIAMISQNFTAQVQQASKKRRIEEQMSVVALKKEVIKSEPSSKSLSIVETIVSPEIEQPRRRINVVLHTS